jgi:hypothetical protein
MPWQRKAVLACALLFLIDFIVYLRTLSPAVQFIDSGELAVVCSSLGIAHPTGYPLYTLLGRLFSLLPLQDVIFRLNLMSLSFACLANVILFFVLVTCLQSVRKTKEYPSAIEIWSALLAALIFSFTPTLWSQATSNEVYALNVLLYSLILLLVLVWQNGKKASVGERVLCLLMFIYGLSFGNHMSTILILPALCFILIVTYRRTLFRVKRLLPILALFLLGLSIYLFLPVRASQNPLVDWGHPQNWANFKRHVTGWQYQVWMFAESTDMLIMHFENFVKLFFHQFPFYLLPFSVLGIYQLLVRSRRILIFFLILFLANVVYGINYEIPDIDSYFLGAFLVNAILVGVGLHFLFEMIRNPKIKPALSFGIMTVFALLPLVLLEKNHFESDQSRTFFASDYAANVMHSVKKDAVILTNVWDHCSPWLYLRYVELRRPDADYVDVELCRRSWYFNYMKENYRDLYRGSEDQITEFLKEVRPFENRQAYNPQVIERAYVNMLNSFVSRNLSTRPVYDDVIGETKIDRTYLRVPEGLVFSIKDSLKYYPYDFPNFELRGIQDKGIYRDERTLFILKRYPEMVDARLRYLTYFKRQEESDRLMREFGKLLSEPMM